MSIKQDAFECLFRSAFVLGARFGNGLYPDQPDIDLLAEKAWPYERKELEKAILESLIGDDATEVRRGV